MNLLAFDTSNERMSVAVQILRDGSITCWQHEGEGGAQTSAHLIPSIQALMVQAGLGFEQLDAIVFGCGPGSFTGLRTACAVAQGLAWGAEVPVLPVDTLLTLAEQARFDHAPEALSCRVLALLDARMDELYVGGYAFSQGLWQQTLASALLRPEQVSADTHHLLAGHVPEAYVARLLSQRQQRVHRQHGHRSAPGQPLRNRAGGAQTSERARPATKDDGVELLKTQPCLRHERLNTGNQMGRGLGAALTLMLPACAAAIAQDLDGQRHALGTGVKRQQVHAATLRWIRTPNNEARAMTINEVQISTVTTAAARPMLRGEKPIRVCVWREGMAPLSVAG